ncbi:MAG: endonuclease III [Nitrospirae bacterium]|nr:endonuclease III [Nitrospirota bacterium]
MDRKEKMQIVIKRLRKEYPELKCALNFSNPFQLLVATILSAQSTDIQVNKMTKTLFQKYQTIRDFAEASPELFRTDVSSVNFYNNKAKNIQATASMVLDQFHGKVPATMQELIQLPAVARKTANIVLYNAFGITEGIAVDTHVKRLANRLGLTRHEDPVKIEKDLMAITPKADWGDLTHMLIEHGRAVCQARKPMHEKCVLADICPSREI